MLTESNTQAQLSINEYRATIDHFLSAPEPHHFVKTMRTIDLGGCPAHNYFALNFKDDKPENFKIYFSFCKKLSFGEILRVLPTTADIEPFYCLFEQSKIRDMNHTGFSLAIKINQELKLTYQVHFRFMYSPILPQPKLIKLSQSDYKFAQGVSFEYTGAQTFRKNYYYLNRSSAYKTVLSRFGGADRNHLIEYTETDKWNKVIHWYHNISDVQEYIQLSKGTNYYRFLKWVESEYDMIALFPGIYDDQRTRSIYFFSARPEANQLLGFYGNSNIETVHRLQHLRT